MPRLRLPGTEPPNPAQSFFDSVAKHLGISSQKLEDATKAAAIDQVDAALKAGRITKEQADAMKARINSGKTPFLGPFFGPGFGGGPGFGHGSRHFHGPPLLFGDKLSAAAKYLGLTEEQLRAKLDDGKTLAQIAKAQGKSVAGLEKAMLDAVQANLDQLVKDGKLTQKQADEFMSRIKEHLDDLVNHLQFRFHFRDGQGHPFGPPPADQSAPQDQSSFQ